MGAGSTRNKNLSGLVRQDVSLNSLAADADLAVARAHGDLATYLAELIVNLRMCN